MLTPDCLATGVQRNMSFIRKLAVQAGWRHELLPRRALRQDEPLDSTQLCCIDVLCDAGLHFSHLGLDLTQVDSSCGIADYRVRKQTDLRGAPISSHGSWGAVADCAGYAHDKRIHVAETSNVWLRIEKVI